MKNTKRLLGICCGIFLIIGFIYHYSAKARIDQIGPVLTAESDEITVSIHAAESELIKDVTALDETDGDVSDGILIESIEKKEDGVFNEFLITYIAFDKANNVGEFTRTLFYEDYRQTHFSFTQELRFPENQKIVLFDYIYADDCIDGAVSAFITLEGDKEIQEKPGKGIYDCTLSVINSVGARTELPVQVEIYEDGYEERTLRPQIYLKEYVTYLKQGETWNPGKYLDYVYDRGNVMIDNGPMITLENGAQVTEQVANGSKARWVNVSQIGVDSDVDTAVPGVYSVRYTYTSEETGYDGNTKLVVVVE